MQPITLSIEVNASIEDVWKIWNTPRDIMNWNNVSDKWHTPAAQNDLRPGGKLLLVMGLKDGSFSFNFEGTYNEVITHRFISYTLADGRQSAISFAGVNPVTIT
ncbi:MAG: SRPBCC domain-containing protein, partial [Mucilaginibacter sp.]